MSRKKTLRSTLFTAQIRRANSVDQMRDFLGMLYLLIVATDRRIESDKRQGQCASESGADNSEGREKE